MFSTDISDINAEYCRNSFVKENLQADERERTEARHPRECDVEINGNSLVPYLVNHDISIKIDCAVVDQFNKG